MPRHFRLAWQAIGILIAITFGLLAWHQYGMNARYELTGGRYSQDVQDDRTIGIPPGERRKLRAVEQELEHAHGARRTEVCTQLLKRLDDIEELVNQISIPLAFADALYGLRSHINFVRQRVRTLLATEP